MNLLCWGSCRARRPCLLDDPARLDRDPCPVGLALHPDLVAVLRQSSKDCRNHEATGQLTLEKPHVLLPVVRAPAEALSPA